MSRQHTTIAGQPTSSDAAATRHESSYDRGSDSSSDRPAPIGSQSQYGAPQRKITGVLVTFTWERFGALFRLYEGRNLIGKDNPETPGGRPCDVWAVDPTMSSEHAVILCRAGRYELFDNRSTNGTYADDQFVESAGVMLKDGMRIKTGDTVWLFRKIESDDAPAHPGPSHRKEPEPQKEGSRWNEPREPHQPGPDDSRIG